jgi:uncharacterized protein
MSPDLRAYFPQTEIEQFCRRWRITELAAFGSVLRQDFGPESDIDLLATFEPDARWTLFDLVHMNDELSALLGRKVDLISRRGVEASRNPSGGKRSCPPPGPFMQRDAAYANSRD